MAVVIKNRLCQTPLIASLNAIADGEDKRAEGRAALRLSSSTTAHSLRNWTLPRQMEMMLLVHPCSPTPAGLWHLRTFGSGTWGRAPWSHILTRSGCILCYLQGTGRPRQSRALGHLMGTIAVCNLGQHKDLPFLLHQWALCASMGDTSGWGSASA